MRKTTTFKLLMALVIATASVFGLLPATAPPAEAAMQCPSQILGPGGYCTFSGYELMGDYICCMYYCTNGQYLEGPCRPM